MLPEPICMDCYIPDINKSPITNKHITKQYPKSANRPDTPMTQVNTAKTRERDHLLVLQVHKPIICPNNCEMFKINQMRCLGESTTCRNVEETAHIQENKLPV